MHFEVLVSHIKHDGEWLQVGEVVEIPESAAAAMLERGELRKANKVKATKATAQKTTKKATSKAQVATKKATKAVKK